jgi:hypothetical protein
MVARANLGLGRQEAARPRAPHLQTDPNYHLQVQAKTELSTVRMRLLELAHRHDFSASQVIERAAELEAYVLRGQPEATPKADKPEGPAS